MRRFYFNPASRNGDSVVLSEEESRHIAKVLRLGPGNSLALFDGGGNLYRAVITGVGRQVEARIEGVDKTVAEVGTPIQVWQGVLKGEKMDTVVQKCTELGVHELIPFWSSRCQGKLDRAKSAKKHQRWQRIGLAACKQCLRLRTMEICSPLSYSDSLKQELHALPVLRLLFWEEEKTTRLSDIVEIGSAESVAVMLGPEGGFTEEEVDQACLMGWQTVSLGDRILRAETATLSAVSIVQYLAGNL